MAIKFDKITPGMVLFDIHRERASNTMMTRLGCWEVRVISVDAERRTARVSWNGNREETWYAVRLQRLFAKKPPSYLTEVERTRARGW